MKLKALFMVADPAKLLLGVFFLAGGLAVAIREVGISGVDWSLTVPAIVACVLLHFVGHLLNDITDYPVDMKANIKETGRRKALVTGLATKGDFMKLAAAVSAVIGIIAIYIVVNLPLAIVFVVIGLFALLGYNMPPVNLSYRPFSEITVYGPLVVSWVMGIAFVATHRILFPAALFAVVYWLWLATYQIGMHAMDEGTDQQGGKITTLVRYPRVYWCTLYPLMGFLVTLYLLRCSQLFLLPVASFGLLAFIGSRIDAVRWAYRNQVPDLKKASALAKVLSDRQEKVVAVMMILFPIAWILLG